MCFVDNSVGVLGDYIFRIEFQMISDNTQTTYLRLTASGILNKIYFR